MCSSIISCDLRLTLLFQMNVNPEDLIPKLPKPKDLQPFPTTQALVSQSALRLVYRFVSSQLNLSYA